MQGLQEIWRYRLFIVSTVRREFALRYFNSLLGSAWAVIQPMAMIVVYTVIFSQIMLARLPEANFPLAYSFYLCAGLLTWTFFAEIVNRSLIMFLENANMLKKLNFPHMCFPLAIVFSALLNFSIIFGIFTIVMIISGHFPGWAFLGLVPVLIIQIAFAFGLGLGLGVLNVFFRDVGQLTSIILQLLFWCTPIVYPISILPAALQAWVSLSPFTVITSAYQQIIVYGRWPNWYDLSWVAAFSLLLCAWGAYLYRAHAHELVDEL